MHLRHISTDILVLAGIMQKINQLHQCFLSLVLTCYIAKLLPVCAST